MGRDWAGDFAGDEQFAASLDAWTLCKIMGWASLSVAMRYVHPSTAGQTAVQARKNDVNAVV